MMASDSYMATPVFGSTCNIGANFLPSCIVRYEKVSRTSLISFSDEEQRISIWQNSILLRNKKFSNMSIVNGKPTDHAFLSNI